MKKFCMILAMMVLGLTCLTGCRQEPKSTTTEVKPVEAKTVPDEAAKAAEKPADQKPKDHPAH